MVGKNKKPEPDQTATEKPSMSHSQNESNRIICNTCRHGRESHARAARHEGSGNRFQKSLKEILLNI